MQMLRDIELPSNGALYPLKKITLDAIGFEQEKKLFSSSSDNVVDEIIQECVVEPKNFDVKSLAPKDRDFILFNLRSHSYGPEYHVRVREGGKVVEKEVSLDDMEVKILPEGYKPPSGKMPLCGDTVELQVPTVGMLNRVREFSAEKADKLNLDYNDVYYEQSKALYIKTINGEAPDINKKIQWLTGLKGKDLRYYDYLIDKIDFGYTGKVPVTLEDGTETEALVRITTEFFRCRFDD